MQRTGGGRFGVYRRSMGWPGLPYTGHFRQSLYHQISIWPKLSPVGGKSAGIHFHTIRRLFNQGRDRSKIANSRNLVLEIRNNLIGFIMAVPISIDMDILVVICLIGNTWVEAIVRVSSFYTGADGRIASIRPVSKTMSSESVFPNHGSNFSWELWKFRHMSGISGSMNDR